MSDSATNRLDELLLQHDIERLYAREAHLLDERRFEEWLELFTDDVRIRVPIARNVSSKQIEREYLEDTDTVAWIDDDKETLAQRVAQIRTGVHWAEEPLSRTVHVVANVLIEDREPTPVDATELAVRSSIITYRHRLNDQEHTMVGRRHDRLVRASGDWAIASRTLYLSQTVYLGSSMSHFL